VRAGDELGIDFGDPSPVATRADPAASGGLWTTGFLVDGATSEPNGFVAGQLALFHAVVEPDNDRDGRGERDPGRG
jgi:hypothetical protein